MVGLGQEDEELRKKSRNASRPTHTPAAPAPKRGTSRAGEEGELSSKSRRVKTELYTAKDISNLAASHLT